MQKKDNILIINYLNLTEALFPQQVDKVVGAEGLLIAQLGAFEGGQKVLPVDCDRLAWEMKDLAFASVSLCELLNNPKYCSSSITVARYQFLNDLFGIQQQAEQLEKLSSTCRSICLVSNK